MYDMAYFGSNYYEAEPGVYLPIPYSCYEFVRYDPPNPFVVGAYDHPAMTPPAISYSVTTVSRPNLVVYDPFHTHFTVSYNKTGFNVPDFEDYDPTPYGGGYDIAQTYGKPLPPSDQVCYPRQSPPASGVKEEDHASASASASASAAEPQKGGQPTAAVEEEQEQEQEQQSHDHGSNLGNPLGSSQSEETEGNYYDDYYPWTGYEYEYGNGRSDSREYEKQVPQAPWGYSPEAMEFCESIFGHWPCLYRQKNYGHGGIRDEERNSNQWKGTADFLFGSSYPYTQ